MQAFPCLELYPYVDRYWAWENPGQGGASRLRLLPGTGMELVFHYGNPFYLEQDDGTFVELPQAHPLCLRGKSAVLRAQPRTGFVSVRFRAGGFRHFCRASAELADKFLALEDVAPRMSHLKTQITEADDFAKRVGLIETCLLRLLHAAKTEDCRIDRAVQSLYYKHAQVRPALVCESIGMGLRQFQRSFKTAMGVSPKRFIRLSRFQHTVKSLLLTGAADMAGTALRHGFYDQSHFIRDFSELTGQAPGAFLESHKGMPHFYNTSRPPKA